MSTPWGELCSSGHKPKRRKRKAKYVCETKEKKRRGGEEAYQKIE